MICNDKHLSLLLRNTYIAMLARIVKKNQELSKYLINLLPKSLVITKKCPLKKITFEL